LFLNIVNNKITKENPKSSLFFVNFFVNYLYDKSVGLTGKINLFNTFEVNFVDRKSSGEMEIMVMSIVKYLKMK